MSLDRSILSEDEALRETTLAWIHNVLQPFDIPPDYHDFFTEILLNQNVALNDLDALCDSSLENEDEKDRRFAPHLDKQSVSHFQSQNLWRTTDSLIALAHFYQTQPCLQPSTTLLSSPWQETDRLIARAKDLQNQAETSRNAATPSSLAVKSEEEHPTRKRKRKQAAGAVSHFFGDECATTVPEPRKNSLKHAASPSPQRLLVALPEPPKCEVPHPPIINDPVGTSKEVTDAPPVKEETPKPEVSDTVLRAHRKASHYFTPSPPTQKSPSKRPSAGTVSCMPFPPLDAPSFGLIQGKVAHEPFWLLIVVTFLIKTKGKTAAPVFWAVKDRFPTPDDLASPDNAGELLDMIRHLGLANNRLKMLQKYGRLWRDHPPEAGKVYRVRNYDRRDLPLSQNASDAKLGDADNDGVPTPKQDGEVAEAEAWEIGHMTAGKYALDSWRIFCRDVLLGRAEGWNGEGARPEFQPEWCRVQPADKELRAYLRWMWMREGFEWDPVTSERTALRPEMMRAVNEGRVEWDDAGSLRIVEEPRL